MNVHPLLRPPPLHLPLQARLRSTLWGLLGAVVAVLGLMRGVAATPAASAGAGVVGTPASPEPRVDFSRPAGVIRALHGINKGPLAPGGLIDLTAAHQALAVPSIRLHDCHWPNPDVVDIHAVFPDPEADPELPESYDFRMTDAYLRAVNATGARIIYRLGESIEHTPVRRFVHPPRDMERWAAVCRGIVRHYNEGWAGGFTLGITHWEIWNEPENRPAMWSGSDEDYFRLYSITARLLRKHDARLKIGGPAVGASGRFVAGNLEPSPFVRSFLQRCKQESLPLDFFSWHCYTDDPEELLGRGRAIRALLDAHGFTGTESHLNEWNYLPGNSWAPLDRRSDPKVRQAYFRDMAGPAAAAFLGASLTLLQDARVDEANLFHGELGSFGIFDEAAVPQKNHHALMAFRRMLETPVRVATPSGLPPGMTLLAGMTASRSEVALLVSRSGAAAARGEHAVRITGLPWDGPSRAEAWVVDVDQDLEPARTAVALQADGRLILPGGVPSVVLVKLRAAGP